MNFFQKIANNCSILYTLFIFLEIYRVSWLFIFIKNSSPTLASTLGIYGYDFKKEFSPVLKKMYLEKFEKMFTFLREKYRNLSSEDELKNKINNYLNGIYEIREKWASGDGEVYFSFNILITLIMNAIHTKKMKV